MATLRDIKRRIVGVKSTQQITKAMKMVAAARLRRAQENIINARPYAKKIGGVLSHLMSIEKNIVHPLLTEREVKNVALIVITFDRGLCGSFNTNIIRQAEDMLKGELSELNNQGKVQLYCIGKKGNDYFSKRNFNVVGSYPGVFSALKFDLASSLMKELTTKFINNEIDKVVVIYNEFRSVIQQKTTVEQLLPIKPFENTTEELSKSTEYIYEPDKVGIIKSLLPKHLNAQIWRMLLESNAAALGAQMTAMDMATENAKELIRSLQLTFNKVRQASITTEILEIVSGANALKEA